MTKNVLKEGALAGLIAGLVFMILEMVLVPLALEGSTWGPPRMIAAMVLGQEVLPPPATFQAGIVIVGWIVHFALSAIFGIILAPLVRNATKGTATIMGALFGLVLYFVNFFLIAELLFPWFLEATNWVSIISHLAFGSAAGYGIKVFQGQYEENCVTC